ncbi:MAG: rhamnulokinase [Planctomycetales bacterium]|nr:rhamnulokinase [Planctomycetales bacterium]
MSARQTFLAVDLGASSGRVVAGHFDGASIQLEDVHRFPNGGVYVKDRLYWNLLGLWEHVQQGLRNAAQQRGSDIVSVGVDTWGVDFGLLGADGNLLGNPLAYRDKHTEGILEQAFQTVSREEIFGETGLQFMPFNSLYQLVAMKRDQSPALQAAQTFMMIPDLFHWMMTGVVSNEHTNATTTQMLNPRTGTWSQRLLDGFGLPAGMLGPTTAPGTALGPLLPRLQAETGLAGSVQVVLPGTHDTASAVMAVPATGEVCDQPNWCYISSGTWSLMGVEVAHAVINERCLELNFTNEGGVGGSYRLLKNIAGLWLIQECRRIWQRESQQEVGFAELVDEARAAPALVSLVNPDDPRLVAPDHMPAALAECCKSAGEPVPAGRGAVTRCALESLAMRYRMVLEHLEELTGGRIDVVHIVGGGTQNQLLCQMTADATNRQVAAGPVEATALGNAMMQAVAAGAVSSIQQAREVIRASSDIVIYEPQQAERWDEPYARFRRIVEAG